MLSIRLVQVGTYAIFRQTVIAINFYLGCFFRFLMDRDTTIMTYQKLRDTKFWGERLEKPF